MKNNLESILKTYWGYDDFRPKQLEIIESVLQKKDTLALLPTGGGKSICYQLPALYKEGTCIVISPLIALMQDQVEGLNKRNIKSSFINSTMSKKEIDITLDNCIYGDIKLLYVSPERLRTDIFIERFKKMKVSFVAIDEAHCISQWGYDFRPEYLKIVNLKNIKPDLSFIALTATATNKVAIDIQQQLNFKQFNVIKNSFYRPNLSYKVIRTENKFTHLSKLLTNEKKSAIIYTNSRRKCHEIAKYLNKHLTKALVYHAGINSKDRELIQSKWINNEYPIIVATNAFGMGIDKPDVGIVINYDLPNSIEAYFQEAGRAGRNGELASSYLLVNESDKTDLTTKLYNKYPTIKEIQSIYQKFCNLHQIAIGSGEEVSYPINFNSFSELCGFSSLTVYHSLRILDLSGHIKMNQDQFISSNLKFLIFHNELINFTERNLKYRNLINVILRSYTGLFDHPTSINELTISKRLNSKPEKVKSLLEELNELKIASYQPQKKDTFIRFLTPRLDSRKLVIPGEIYNKRKESDLQKIKAVIDYAYSTDVCRNEILLEYFGEQNKPDYCNCDVCENNLKNKNAISNEQIVTSIKTKLSHKPLEINEVIGKDRTKEQKKQITYIIRKMLDANELTINDLNQLQLVEK